MYHYVRKYNKNYPNLNFLDYKNFVNQLNYFEIKFGFVSKELFEEIFLKKNTKLFHENKNKILLTFDDATYCHYDFVFKELKKRKLFGIFNISSKPYLEGKPLNVNRVQAITSKISSRKLYNFLKEVVNENMYIENLDNDILNLPYKHYNNPKYLSEFKKIINYQLKGDFVSDIIDEIEIKFDIKKIDHNWYINIEQIREMSEYGMVFGCHTHNHFLMNNLRKNSQQDEIIKSWKFLHKIINQNYKIYCHPFGRSYSFNKETLDILSENNFDLALNVESRNVKLEDITRSIFTLPRYNCNEFLKF